MNFTYGVDLRVPELRTAAHKALSRGQAFQSQKRAYRHETGMSAPRCGFPWPDLTYVSITDFGVYNGIHTQLSLGSMHL